jgi:hypothetical protein
MEERIFTAEFSGENAISPFSSNQFENLESE